MNENGYKLAEAITALSESKTWDRAKLEWRLEDVYYEEEPDTCLCGHTPINELCYIRNTKNNNRALVGNVCVKKFLGLPSDKIFQAVNRIAKDRSKALNAEAIEHAFAKGWISDWENKFYFDTWRKRSLSFKQSVKRAEINDRVLGKIRNARNQQPETLPDY